METLTPVSPLTPEAENVAKKRYYVRDENGNIIEDWSGLARRVVNYVCQNESQEFKDQMYNLIYNTKFLPNSPCLVNAGRKVKSGLLACFVTQAPEDSWIGMCKNTERFGCVARRGGGCGVCLSHIRPEGDPVFGSTHAKACGPIEHMRTVSETMLSITQSGFRGMACLASMHIWHPDIEKFIECKQRERALRTLLKEDIFQHYDQLNGKTHEHLNIVLDKFISNFNISVMSSDKFMRAVENDEDWNLEFNGKIYKTIKAKYLFDLIAENAWKNGDPGFLFEDAINNGPYRFSRQYINATNPCGEQPLPQFGSCNLGSIDISKFYIALTNNINWNEFGRVVKCSVQFLDDVIDVNQFPTPEFASWAIKNRPVGLGIMGWADLLLRMGVSYGSEESLLLAAKVARFMEETAYAKSVELAKLKGTPEACKYPELNYRRNVTLTSIAPTGTISLLAGCSSSIEPIFAPTVYRYDNTGQYIFPHEYADKKYFRCAVDKEQNGKREVTWEEHIKMQAAWQKYGSSGISKTVNLPNSATIEDVRNAYMLAWSLGCKGITVYRDGCKTTQVLNTSKKIDLDENHALPRPDSVDCDIFKTTADGFDWHIMIGKINNQPYELFAVNGKYDLPKHGKIIKKKKKHYVLIDENNNELIANIVHEQEELDHRVSLESRRFSLELRHKIPVKYIVDQIDKSSERLVSFSKAVGRIMKREYLTAEDMKSIAKPCPECLTQGESINMVYESGCAKCPKCSYSKCG